jgi:plasmid stability protein
VNGLTAEESTMKKVERKDGVTLVYDGERLVKAFGPPDRFNKCDASWRSTDSRYRTIHGTLDVNEADPTYNPFVRLYRALRVPVLALREKIRAALYERAVAAKAQEILGQPHFGAETLPEARALAVAKIPKILLVKVKPRLDIPAVD